MSRPAPGTLLLVDASLYVFRAWFALPPDWHDQDGWPTQAVRGFTQTLLDLIETTGADQIAVCFDEALGTSFRNALYPAYKANRDPAPAELVRQFAHCQALTRALGCTALVHPEYEADDLIAALARKARARGQPVWVISADKDLGQVLGEQDRQWDFGRGLPFGPDGVRERFGVGPEQIADLLALCGDAVDNIPGVPGVGPKTAAKLLRHFGDLDGLYADLGAIARLKFRKTADLDRRLAAERERVYLWRRLTEVCWSAPVPEPEQCRRCAPDRTALEALTATLGFGLPARYLAGVGAR